MSGTGGAAATITVTGALSDSTTGTAIGFQVGQTGAGCQPHSGWRCATSASNTVSKAISGVTFQLLASSAGTQVQVEITNDNTAIEIGVSATL